MVHILASLLAGGLSNGALDIPTLVAKGQEPARSSHTNDGKAFGLF